VFGNIFGGQVTSRTGKYKALAIVGTISSAAGMIIFARMGLETPHAMVVFGMVLCGLGLGFVQPVYTVAVQNSAPREHMGTATASTQFFRSIGSTVGVAAFGSVLLTLYKHDFEAGVPLGTPDAALRPFHNPLMLPLIRPQLEAAFGSYPGGMELLQRLFDNVKFSLVHGIQVIFFTGAIIMSAAVLLNLVLREVPLRGRVETPPSME
jgi:MFS family permease